MVGTNRLEVIRTHLRSKYGYRYSRWTTTAASHDVHCAEAEQQCDHAVQCQAPLRRENAAILARSAKQSKSRNSRDKCCPVVMGIAVHDRIQANISPIGRKNTRIAFGV